MVIRELRKSTKTTLGRNNTTRYRYNSLGWLISIIDPLFHTTQYQYDANGNQVLRIAANQLNRLIQRTDPQNYHTRYSYGSVGNVARSENPRGTQWAYKYLPNNLLQELSLTGATGDTYQVSYTYDAAGNRIQVTDQENTINYHPDALNRLTAIDRYFDGATYQTGYQYEQNLLTGVKYPGSSTYLEYTYNQRNLVSGVTGFTESITYHADGSLKETRYTNDALSTYEYDQNRRLNELTAAINDTEILRQQYQFDLVGNITTINDKSYAYDANNQLTKAFTPGEFMEEAEKPHIPGLRDGDYLGDAPIDFSIDSQAVVHLDYNSSSIGLDFGTGGTKLKKVQMVPKLKTQTHRLTANTLELFVSKDNSLYQIIDREDWVFDKDEQGIITITFKETIDTRYLKIHVRFDDRDILFNPVDKATFLNQLSSMVQVYQQASERTEEYQYDAAGNRKKMSLQLVDLFHYDYMYYENSDRLQSDGKFTCAYDEAGNLIRKTKMGGEDGGAEADWAYEYDLLNRLRRVTKNGKIVSSYRYDPEGFRVVKQTAEQTIHYVFEGTEPILEKNITTGQIKSYVYALGKHLARVDGMIGDLEAKVYFYHTDHLGSIKAVTNKTGEVVWNADYLAFGTRFGLSGDSDFEEWHGFTGKEYDPDTGLSYFNARWYDSELGRFISEDPAMDPNNPNLYVNCANNPLVYIDPTGMLFEGIKNAASKVTNAAKNVAKGVANAVKNVTKGAATAAKSVAKGLANTVNSAVKGATNILKNALTGSSNNGGFSLKMIDSHEEYRTPVGPQTPEEELTLPESTCDESEKILDINAVVLDNPLEEDQKLKEKRWGFSHDIIWKEWGLKLGVIGVSGGFKNTKVFLSSQIVILDVEAGYDFYKSSFYINRPDMGLSLQLGPAQINWSIVDATKDLWDSMPDLINKDWSEVIK